MELKNLLFFNTNGKPYNFLYDDVEKMYKGIILFKRISVEMYSTEILRIAERKGKTVVYPTSGEGIDEYLAISWDPTNKYVDEFGIFNYARDKWITDTSALTFIEQDGPDIDFLMTSNKEETYMKLNKNDYDDNDGSVNTLDINICFNADKRYLTRTFARTLYIDKISVNSDNTLNRDRIAEITMLAEAEYEDERLSTLCKNLGYDVSTSDANIFFESNIHEVVPDMILLNRKRREMLLEGPDIYHRLGTYSSLLKAIKYYGYDMKLYEFFKDKNTGKKFMVEYPHKDYSIIDYTRLKYISLAYNITKATNVLDDDGNLKVKEVFDYTVEDACLKLSLLRDKLNKSFMPVSSIIYDITGETVNFQTVKLNNFIQYDRFDDVAPKSHKAKIELVNNDIFITYDKPFKDYCDNNDISNVEKAKLFIKYINEDMLDNESLEESEEIEDSEISAKFVIRFIPLDSNEIKYKNVPMSMYNDILTIETFETKENYSRIDYTILDSDGNIEVEKSGSYDEMYLSYFQLQKSGSHTVICQYYDVYNNMTLLKKLDIYVRPLEVEVNGLYYDARENVNEQKYNIEQKKVILNYIDNVKEYLKNIVEEDSEYYPYSFNNLKTLLYATTDNLSYSVTNHCDESSEEENIFGRLRYVYNGVTVRPYTWIILSCNLSRICGISNISWTVTYNNTIIKEVEREFFYFLYKDEGDYTIDITVTDILGNTSSVRKVIQVRNDDMQSSVSNNFLLRDLEILGKSCLIYM